MIILDTNVVSELTGPRPDPAVLDWWKTLRPQETFLTSITRAEMRHGLARLPAGSRRERLEAAVSEYLDRAAERTLPFDIPAADLYGVIVADRERAGRPISHADAQIAAIARAHRATLATRDRSGFDHTGVRVIDPFEGGTSA